MSRIDVALAKIHHTRKSAVVFAGISILFSLCTTIEYYWQDVSRISVLSLFLIISAAAFIASGFIGHSLERHSNAMNPTPPQSLA